MDITSGNTQQRFSQPTQFNRAPQNNFFKPNNQPRFVSKELFNVSSTLEPPNSPDNYQYYDYQDNYQHDVPDNYQNLDQYYDDQQANEIDDENFQLEASKNQSDT